MKKKIAAISVIIILLSLITSGTYAYFTSADVASNVITTGNVKIKLMEETKDPGGNLIPFPPEGLSGKMPGDTVPKLVKIVNTGNQPVWVRIKTVSLAESSLGVSLPGKIGTPPEDIITFAVSDAAKWKKDSDGLYRYTQELLPGASTDYFIENVTINPKVDNPYQGAKLRLNITAYAVQSANNGADCMEAVGWPAL